MLTNLKKVGFSGLKPPEAETEGQCIFCRSLRNGDLNDVSCEEFLGGIQDSSHLVRGLDKMFTWKRTRCLRTLIHSATWSQGRKELLLSLSGPLAVDVVEIMQELVETSKDCPSCKDRPNATIYPLRRLLMCLSRKIDTLPQALFLDGVDCKERDPVFLGGYADIFLASYQGQKVALKRLRTCATASSEVKLKNRQNFCREALLWCSLDHPNIHAFLGIDKKTFDPYFCMASAWYQNGNIMDCLNKCGRSTDLAILLDVWVKQVLTGLSYLHSNDIVHGDLRGANILIDDGYTAKLADFGLSVFYGSGSTTLGSRAAGAIRFCAPELLESESVDPTPASDIWAFACFCIELHTDRSPFPDINNDMRVMVGLIRGLSPKKPDEPTTSPDGFWEAVEECWLRDPSERPTAASLLSSLPLRAPTSSFYTIQSESHLRGSKKRPCSPSASSDSIESEVEDLSIYAKKRSSQVCPADSSTYELIEPFDLDEWPTESPPQSSLPSQSVVRLSTFQASLQSFDLSEPPPSSISPNHHSGVEYETLPVDLPLSWFTVNEEKKPKLFSSDLDDDLFCLSEEAVEDSRLTEHEGGGQRAPKGLSPTISMTDPDYRSIEILDAWKKITSVFQSSDLDIDALCSEFTSKARCDGNRIVLKPGDVQSIIETTSANRQQRVR